jgi:uncharacterized protein YraI
MIRQIRFAFALLIGLATVASAQTAAYARSRISLRSAPSFTASVVVTIPSGAQLNRGGCANYWCAATYGALAGYVYESLLADTPTQTAPPQVESQGRGYTNSAGEWVPSPRRTADGRPPAGASAQCRDETYSFSRSRRGTCSHHGGVARWLP